MKIGFTGSRVGGTYDAHNRLRAVLQALQPTELHHGDCIGADSEAHSICRSIGREIAIVVHPPDKDDYRAFRPGDETRDPLPYLQRNNSIASECDLLIAIPQTEKEEVRSGTWSTVRKAIEQDKPTMIINPDGGVVWR